MGPCAPFLQLSEGCGWDVRCFCSLPGQCKLVCFCSYKDSGENIAIELSVFNASLETRFCSALAFSMGFGMIVHGMDP